jgi:endonuclease/exonuclease/phosphatase family metal-dependent hydrolase
MNNISIATFNIHDFYNSDMEETDDKIIDIINQYDIIALQEVYNHDKLEKIKKNRWWNFNRNTLTLSKYSLDHVDIGSNTKERYNISIIHIPGMELCVINLHLNYKNETIRLRELNDILKKAKLHTDNYQSILLGDFNALTKNDYNDKKWNDIHKIREKGKWELPVHQLTDAINKEWNDSGKNNYHPTSRYDTRIDYIYTKNIDVKSYDVVKMIPNISDHNLVNISFTNSFCF